MQHARIPVQRRVRKADRALPRLEQLLVDPVQDRREHGRTRARAPAQPFEPLVHHDDVVAHGAHVRDAAADAVVDPLSILIVEIRIRRIGRVVVPEVARHGGGLVVRDGIDVREPAAGAEARGGDLGVCGCGGAGGKGGAADVGDVGAVVGVGGGEDLSVGPEAVGFAAIAGGGAGDAVVAGGDEDGSSCFRERCQRLAGRTGVGERRGCEPPWRPSFINSLHWRCW